MKSMRAQHRLDGLDNLKVVLTFLVVAHHAGQPYGQSNGFWYFESGDSPINLGVFFSTNAGFFMSLFFFISAYFMPTSYERKGAMKFVVERLKKFGLPLITGFFIMVPLLMYVYYSQFRQYPTIDFWSYYRNIYFGLAGMPNDWSGPSWPDMQFAHLWFIQHLLVYTVIYACFRVIFEKKKWFIKNTTRSIGLKHLLYFSFFLSLLTFTVRIYYPIDYWTGFLGFIQTEFAHLPQYAALFFAGILTARYRWLEQLTPKIGIVSLLVGVTIVALRYTGRIKLYSKGGTSLESLGYAFMETFLCVSLCIGLIWLFQNLFNRSNKTTRLLSSASFGVYVIHVPIVVILQYLLVNVSIITELKFFIVTVVGSVLSFLLTFIYHAVIKKQKSISTNYKKVNVEI